MRPLTRYFSRLRQFVKLTPKQRRQYLVRPQQDFTRKSPLTFQRTVALIIDLARQSLAVELANFFHYRPEDIVTKSAFSQRRKAIHPGFFRDLFEQSVSWFYRCFPEHKQWKGKRLVAVDGTGQSLPFFERIGRTFGFHQNQHDARPSTRMLVTHDVLSNIIYDVNFHGQDTAEIVVAYQNVAHHARDAIYIYDRHYASFALAYLHDRNGSDYLIRMKTKGNHLVERFIQSADKQCIVSAKLKTGRAYYKLVELGLRPERNVEFKVRLVRVELADGTVEVLMTSLLNRRRYPASVFKWLYGKRWGVETAILTLKSFLQLALVSAKYAAWRRAGSLGELRFLQPAKRHHRCQ